MNSSVKSLVPRVTDLPELVGVLELELELELAAGVELELEELDELLPQAASTNALSTATSVRATRTAGGRG